MKNAKDSIAIVARKNNECRRITLNILKVVLLFVLLYGYCCSLAASQQLKPIQVFQQSYKGYVVKIEKFNVVADVYYALLRVNHHGQADYSFVLLAFRNDKISESLQVSGAAAAHLVAGDFTTTQAGDVVIPVAIGSDIQLYRYDALKHTFTVASAIKTEFEPTHVSCAAEQCIYAAAKDGGLQLYRQNIHASKGQLQWLQLADQVITAVSALQASPKPVILLNSSKGPTLLSAMFQIKPQGLELMFEQTALDSVAKMTIRSSDWPHYAVVAEKTTANGDKTKQFLLANAQTKTVRSNELSLQGPVIADFSCGNTIEVASYVEGKGSDRLLLQINNSKENIALFESDGRQLIYDLQAVQSSETLYLAIVYNHIANYKSDMKFSFFKLSLENRFSCEYPSNKAMFK
jgi:hypothetical protein